MSSGLLLLKKNTMTLLQILSVLEDSIDIILIIGLSFFLKKKNSRKKIETAWILNNSSTTALVLTNHIHLYPTYIQRFLSKILKNGYLSLNKKKVAKQLQLL